MASFQKRDKYYHFRIYYVDNLGKKIICKSRFRTIKEAKKAAIETENKCFKKSKIYAKEMIRLLSRNVVKNKVSDNSFEIMQFSNMTETVKK